MGQGERLRGFGKRSEDGFQVQVGANEIDRLLTKPKQSDQRLFLQQIVWQPESQSVWKSAIQKSCEHDLLCYLMIFSSTIALNFGQFVCIESLIGAGHNDLLLMKHLGDELEM